MEFASWAFRNACVFVSRGLMVNPTPSPSFISGVIFPTKHVLRSWWIDDVKFLRNELACATVDPVYTPNPCVHILIHVYTWFPVYTTNPCVHNKSMCTHELVCVHKDLMCTHAGPNCWMNQKPKNSNSKIIIILFFIFYRSWKKEKRAKKMTECKTEHNNFNFVHTIWIWIFNMIGQGKGCKWRGKSSQYRAGKASLRGASRQAPAAG